MAILIDSRVSYEDFSNTVIEILEKQLDGKKKLKIQKVKKNNNVEKDGLVIDNPECEITPTFYMEDLYEACINGAPVNEIVDKLLPYYEKDYSKKPFEDLLFTDFEMVRDKIGLKLINTAYNRDLLEETPHIAFLDLSIVFTIMTINKFGEIGAMLINYNLLKSWDDKDTFDLYEAALKNTQEQLGVRIDDMTSLLVDMIKNAYSDCDEKEADEKNKLINDVISDGCKSEIYVMSNNAGSNGAATILFDNLKVFADQLESDLYIIPSSVHEVLLIPVKKDISKEALESILRNVNSTELKATDILSDHLYYYSQTKRIITAI